MILEIGYAKSDEFDTVPMYNQTVKTISREGDETIYRCRFCGKEYKRMRNMTDHLALHISNEWKRQRQWEN